MLLSFLQNNAECEWSYILIEKAACLPQSYRDGEQVTGCQRLQRGCGAGKTGIDCGCERVEPGILVMQLYCVLPGVVVTSI